MPVTVSKFNAMSRISVDGTVDYDNPAANAFKVMLLSGYSFNAAHASVADVVANEIANGNGYASGGQGLTGVTLTTVGAVATFDADDVTWNATGAGISADGAVIFYDDGAASNAQRELLAYLDFGGTQTAGPGVPFKLVWSASGILQIT